jgi:hypothetical protein
MQDGGAVHEKWVKTLGARNEKWRKYGYGYRKRYKISTGEPHSILDRTNRNRSHIIGNKGYEHYKIAALVSACAYPIGLIYP